MAMKGKPAAIVGHFVNYKPVLGRDVLTLVIEVPSVAAAQVFAALGYPTGGVSIPVAVARLEEAAALAQPAPKDALQTLEETSDKANRKLAASINAKTRHLQAMGEALRDEPLAAPTPPRHWSEMTPAQQTGVIRNEPDFHEFAGCDAWAARDYIRDFCGVKSCADILPGTEAAAKWAELQVRYGNWLRERRGAA